MDYKRCVLKMRGESLAFPAVLESCNFLIIALVTIQSLPESIANIRKMTKFML